MITIICTIISLVALFAGFVLGVRVGKIRLENTFWDGYREGRKDS